MMYYQTCDLGCPQGLEILCLPLFTDIGMPPTFPLQLLTGRLDLWPESPTPFSSYIDFLEEGLAELDREVQEMIAHSAEQGSKATEVEAMMKDVVRELKHMMAVDPLQRPLLTTSADNLEKVWEWSRKEMTDDSLVQETPPTTVPLFLLRP